MFFKLSAEGLPARLTADKNGRTKEHEHFTGADGRRVGTSGDETEHLRGLSRDQLRGADAVSERDGDALDAGRAGRALHRPARRALVPRGIRYKWSSDTVRKFWVIFDAQAGPRSPTAGRYCAFNTVRLKPDPTY